MNWLFLVLLAFCILGVIRGACKGLVRMAVSMVFLVLVFVLASVINPYVSSFIRDNTELYRTFTESCSDMIEYLDVVQPGEGYPDGVAVLTEYQELAVRPPVLAHCLFQLHG